ncbi:glycosyltransferase family 4 protein [Limosilactobacillus fermentum]|uniref:glycosyltransferase family 4 protein n=1 Tax=Lactobacillaceae TaxID=33958 RepID=UPI0030EB589F
MTKVSIIHSRYTDEDGKIKIGGVESYINALSGIIQELGYELSIFQYGIKDVEHSVNNVRVVDVGNAKRPSDLLEYISKNENPDFPNDLIIFASDYMISNNRFKHSIAIQHGVAWDITSDRRVSRTMNYANIIKNALRAIRKYNKYRECHTLVSVDYNFPNWYRSEVKHIDNNLVVIPNFARITRTAYARLNDNKVRIIFARRLVEYRGTRLFVNAIRPLLERYPFIEVVIAGDGPDGVWMQNELASFDNVKFIKFESRDSVKVHSQFDIAVVPTKGSEGTSLSLLEAMAAGCAVVTTGIGGLSNIIIDGYNGRIVIPKTKPLENAIEELITNPKLRNTLSSCGKITVREAFSFEKWSHKWKELLAHEIAAD